jgi:PAS domain S-box-containing protein
MIYNSRYYSKDIIRQAAQLRSLQVTPELMRLQFNSFLQNEVFTSELYQTEKSRDLDSIESLAHYHLTLIDSLKDASFFASESLSSANAIRNELDLFIDGNKTLFKAIIERGFQQTGKAGDLFRQGEFLENYIASLRNPVLLKSWINIRKYEYRYNMSHNSNQLDLLNDETIKLKAAVLSSGDLAKSMSDGDRLRIASDLDKYLELVVAFRTKDKEIGFGTDAGLIGKQWLSLNSISAKSKNISNNVEEQLNKLSQKQFILRLIFLTFLTASVIVLLTVTFRNITESIRSIIDYLLNLARGKLPEPVKVESKDELGKIAILLNEFVFSLRKKIKFAQGLGAGKEMQELKPLSNEDTLANALLDLQVSLKKASEEDLKYKIDEKKRAWSNEGLAKFSEILRFQTSNIGELSDLIIKNLVKYLNANQGGVFNYVDDIPEDAHLELVSAFAFERKKYLTKRINIGEGLIGTCAQEKLSIFMTDIPEDYISITSGLGEAKPRCLLIVPLKTEEDIYGVIEIASFNILEPHEIEFVEKLAESIASTFASLKINVHTSQLLEQSRRQAEEMAQQEEEMRQNLEELQATQEESARKEAEIMSILGAIDHSSMMLELDMDGKIIEVNSRYCSTIKCNREDLIGKNLRAICFFNPQTDDYNYLWGELRNGRSVVREEEIHYNNKTFFFTQNYSPVFDQDRNPYKILVIASNNTENIQLGANVSKLNDKLSSKTQELENIINVLDQAVILAELTREGNVIRANQNYLHITGYLESEVLNKNARFFLKPEELKQFDLIWGEVEKGKEHKGVVRRTRPTGEEYWLMSAAIPTQDANGQVNKVYFIAQDITEKKLKYQVLEEANKEIERLKGILENNKPKE